MPCAGDDHRARWPVSDSRSIQTAPHQLERADSYYRMRGPVIVHPPTDHPTPHPVESSSAVFSTFLQPPLQRRQSASSLVNNNLVLAESGVMEMQISNMSIVDSHRPDPPANTNTTVPLSSTPRRAPRRASTDGNGVSLLRRSNNSSSADSDMIRRRMITEEEWNGAPHAHQKTTDDPNNLGRYKLAARRRRKINGLKRVA